jgi:uncharacterized protein YlzI (FlbEa/FlbD family)
MLPSDTYLLLVEGKKHIVNGGSAEVAQQHLHPVG